MPSSTHEAFAYVESSGGIESYRHRTNGLQVLLLPEASVPVVTVMVTYRVGSRNESLGLTGATHFLEHLMFKGTERFNKARGTSIFNVLQRLGAQVNATTWFDRTNYYELLPREHLPIALEIEADRMRGARIQSDDLESERTVILNEYDRGRNEPLRNLYHDVWSAAFQAHPYHHPTIGWRSDIEQVTVDGLRHFYDTFYWPDNATLSVIGDVDPETALGLIDRQFGVIPPAPHPLPSVTTREPEQQGERRVVLRQPGEVGALVLAYKAPSALETDSDALDILARVLAGGKSSRLYRRLVDTGRAASVSASASRLRDPGLFVLFGLLVPGVEHAEIEHAIEEEIERIQADGVTGAEVQRARNQLKAQVAFSRDGPFAVASQLNEAIAAGDWTLYTTYLDRIGRVTETDVRQAAQTYMQRDTRTVGWYIPVR